jgi:uncharacterized membrane-anchored protein
MRKLIALIGLVIVLGVVNASIVGKEKHLAEGRVVYLELAPVDPRSLMQGDYMALRFALAAGVSRALPGSPAPPHRDLEAADGHVVVALDERRVGSFRRLDDGQPLARDEVLLRYRVRKGTVKFATNAFFFEEGQGPVYQPARFGQFRVEAEGELLLVALADKDLQVLVPGAQE